MIEISELNIYPVKSLQGISLKTGELGIRGLKYDRNWMITDENYNFLTQRIIPQMATVQVSIKDGKLILNSEAGSQFFIELEESKLNRIETSVWNDKCEAIDEGFEVSKWLTNVLGKVDGKELKLVRFPRDFTRNVDFKHLKDEKSQTAFADGFPFLVTSEESLSRLNNKLLSKGADPVPMSRFRPNIVLRGIIPFEEDKFDTISDQYGIYSFGIRKPCKRCKVTTVNQSTGKVEDPKEPLKTLTEMNPFPNLTGAFFGQNATLLYGEGQTITVADKLNALYK